MRCIKKACSGVAVVTLLGLAGLSASAAPLPPGTLPTIWPGFHFDYLQCFGSYVISPLASTFCRAIGPGTDSGVIVAKSQKSGGQEAGLSDTLVTPGELTEAFRAVKR